MKVRAESEGATVRPEVSYAMPIMVYENYIALNFY